MIVYGDRSSGQTSGYFAHSVASNLGVKVNWSCQYEPGDCIAFGSPNTLPLFNRARAEGFDWYYGDHAYFKRRVYYRITKNHWQHTGESSIQYPSDRWEKLGIPLRDWRKSGSHIIFCIPSEAFAKRQGFDLQAFITNTLAQLREHTDRTIVLRSKIDSYHTPLAHALRDCWAVIVHRSNVAVEALAAGIPAVCLGRCAAWPLSTPIAEIESPRMPDNRLQWASLLAYSQWTMQEIRHGTMWATINETRASMVFS